MKTRTLADGLVVSEIGLGCMGISQMYGRPADDAEGIAVIQRSLGLGMTSLDAAEVYGPYVNETLIGRALKGRREQAVVATKFGFQITDGKMTGVDGSPENVLRACDASLQRLGLDVIDLFYQHRRDRSVPIEDTVGAMAGLVTQGKVRHLGLSEVGPETLRRAHAVHRIAALQSEYSLWERGLEPEILPTLRELGIGLVPFSPLGRGFLTGQITRFEDLDPDDYRRTDPRFQGENFNKNLVLVAKVRPWRRRRTPRPARAPLLGFWRRARASCPFRGLSAFAIWKRTRARRTSH